MRYDRLLDRARSALIVIDVQRAFDEWEAAGKRRNNPDAVTRIVDLLGRLPQAELPAVAEWIEARVTCQTAADRARRIALRNTTREMPDGLRNRAL